MTDEIDIKLVDDAIDAGGGDREALIPVLTRLQESFRYLPEEALRRIADRTGISLGAGYNIGVLRFDVSYMFLMFADRAKDNLVGYSDTDTPNNGVDSGDQTNLNNLMKATGRNLYHAGNGDYESSANLFSVSVSYKF